MKNIENFMQKELPLCVKFRISQKTKSKKT